MGGRRFYAQAGRTKIFTAVDVDRIREAMRCPSISARHVRMLQTNDQSGYWWYEVRLAHVREAGALRV